MGDRQPVQVLPPGYALQEELGARGWSQADFAEIIARPPRLVNEIIKGKRAITPETALALGKALGTGPELWMNLESNYQLSRVPFNGDAIEKRAQIYNRFPVRDLQKRGWIYAPHNLQALERSLLNFFKIDALDSAFKIPHAAKKTSYSELTPQQVAWVARAYDLAKSMKVATYDPTAISKLYEELRPCVEHVDDLNKVPKILARAGVRLILLEPLQGSKIDGASFWLSELDPVVVLSLRYDRHDSFWHALFHELDHIDHKEGQGELLLDTDFTALAGLEDSRRLIEERANQNAASRLIPAIKLDEFVSQSKGAYSEKSITAFARSMNVHAGIVVGQLQHRELILWSSYNFLKSKVRPFITPFALTDGFGTSMKKN